MPRASQLSLKLKMAQERDEFYKNYNHYHSMRRTIRRLQRPPKTLRHLYQLLCQTQAHQKHIQQQIHDVLEAIAQGKPDTHSGHWLAHALPHTSQDSEEDEEPDPQTHYVYKIVRERGYEGGGLSFCWDWAHTPIEPIRLELGQRLYDLERLRSYRGSIVQKRFKEALTQWVRDNYHAPQTEYSNYLTLELDDIKLLLEVQYSNRSKELFSVQWLSEKTIPNFVI